MKTPLIRHALLATALSLVAAGAFAAPTTYQLDPTHTDVIVQWTHFGFSHPSAHFGQANGTLIHDPAKVGASSVEVTLPLAGLDSFVPKLDEHLRSPEFFDAAQFPTITFKSTKVEAAGTNKLKVTGDLTVKGKTRPVVLAVTLNKAGIQPMKKVQAIGFDATATIKRSDFGIDQYVPNVSDEVNLRITTEALASGAADAAK